MVGVGTARDVSKMVSEELTSWGDGKTSASRLSARLGVSERRIRRAVAEARTSGATPIVSGDFGYGMAQSPEEAERCADRLEAHGKRELQAATALRKWAKRKRNEALYPFPLALIGLHRGGMGK